MFRNRLAGANHYGRRAWVCRGNFVAHFKHEGWEVESWKWHRKSKAGASLYLTGIGKVKTRLTLQGAQSTSKAKGASTTKLIIKAVNNTTDPNSFISIFKFEVKGKERRYQLAESGTLSKTEENNLSSVEYKAKKYGQSSYLLVLEDLQPGEYGIVIGDPNNANTKNTMKVTTFTVE